MFFTYLGAVELCLLVPTIFYRFFRVFLIDDLSIKEKIKDVVLTIFYILSIVIVYNFGVMYSFTNFHICLAIIIYIFIIILEYLRIANELLFN